MLLCRFTCALVHSRLSYLLCCFISFYSCSAEAVTAIESEFTKGNQFFEHGKFNQAIHHWQRLLTRSSLTAEQRSDILAQLARTYQILGFAQQAEDILLTALALHPQNSDSRAVVLTSLSDLALATNQAPQARLYAEKSVAQLSQQSSPLIQATVLNNFGNVLTIEAYYRQAISLYLTCVQLAQTAGDQVLVARSLLNISQAYFKNKDWRASFHYLQQAREQLTALDGAHHYAKAFGLLSISELGLQLHSNASAVIQSSSLSQIIYQVLKSAEDMGQQLDNNYLLSYVYGYLGQLYEQQARYDESIRLTRQAIFYGQQHNAWEILYRWQWQLGRVFKAKNQLDKAIEAYRRAVDNLQSVRQELVRGYRSAAQSFREAVGPVYFELADLLLQRAQGAQDNQHWLKEAQNTIERLKTAELQDYFKDNCIAETQSQKTLLDEQVSPQTAVIYPIMLPQRIEILLSLADSIEQFTVPISAQQLKDEVNEFRFELETANTQAFLDYAHQLYQWLIAPLSTTLQTHQITHIISVPDGVLRTIPFAALHNGQQFLIERYTLVTTPGLTLTASQPLKASQHKILINGISKNVQGFAALDNVQQEVKAIQNHYAPRATVLLNEAFSVERFAKTLEQETYTMIHIASHGQFDSNPQKTFLLTYDGQLSINQLEQLMQLSEFRHEPVELLTLSACQTAVGDDQAALGLAGVAIKAGARSALASLWFIEDKATTLLMDEFYRQLTMGHSKAKALQAAQKRLINTEKYQHPIYWAAFLMIGNGD